MIGAFIRYIPRVEAKRILMLTQAMALGSGTMKPEVARREVNRLSRLASDAGDAPPRRSTPQEMAVFARGLKHG